MKHGEKVDLAVDDKPVEKESTYSTLKNQVLHDLQIEHPIIYDTYNICHLHATDKLKKLSVALLKHICVYFDLRIDNLPERRKAPYISLISELVQSGCSCVKNKQP